MRTNWRLAISSGSAGLALAFLAMFSSGCGGGGSSGLQVFGADASDDLGDLFVNSFPFEDFCCVFRDSVLEFNFNGPLAADSVKSSTIRVWRDGDQDVTTNPPCNQLDGDEPGEWIPGQFFIGLNQVTFVPDDFFASSTRYCVMVPSSQEAALAPIPGNLPLIRNVQGNSMVKRYEAFFITSEGFTFSNPIISVTPGAMGSPGTLNVPTSSCIDIVHARPIDTTTVDLGSVQLIDMSTCTAVPGTFTFPTAPAIRFCPSTPLTPATIFQLTVTDSVEDTQGIGSNGGVFFFQTAFPTPDGNAVFAELFDDNFLEEPNIAELPPGFDRADWAGTGMTAAGMVGRLAAAPGPLLPVGGVGTADLRILTGTFHEMDTDLGTVDGGPAPSGGGVPSFLGNGTFQFRDITIGGSVTLEAYGGWPLTMFASGVVQIDGNIDLHGEAGGDALAGDNEPGGVPSALRRAGGMPGGQGAPANGTIGLHGSAALNQVVPLPVMLGEGAGCGGETGIDPSVGEYGSGGGGGGYFYHGFHGLSAASGFRTWKIGFGIPGMCILSKGGLPVQANRALDPLYSGSGGGGGASVSDSPGGGGATGGGSMAVFAAGPITLNGTLSTYGGRGGSILPNGMVTVTTSGGGGGGSGGGMHMVSATVVNLSNGGLDLTFGFGGLAPPPFYSFGSGLGGGHGAVGLIVGEAPVVLGVVQVFYPGPGLMQPTVTPDLSPQPILLGPRTVNPPNLCSTFAMVANFPNAINATATFCDVNALISTMFYQSNVSANQSRWLRITANGVPVGLPGAGAPVKNPNYSGGTFNTANVPSGGTVSIQWQGAEESGPGTGLPKPGTSTPWTTSIDLLDTHELIRFRVSMSNVTLPDLGGPPPVAALLDVTVNYSFNF